MSQQQERARRTRTAIITAAAFEFDKSGYAAASLNRILDGSGATKGAMYFHFDSKEALARAVLEAARERHLAVTARWLERSDLDAFEILHAVVDEIALGFEVDKVARAEFRLIVEPECFEGVQSRSVQHWWRVGNDLADRAREQGLLRPDVESPRFARLLATLLAGQRYMFDLLAVHTGYRRFLEEALEMVLEATATQEWLERFRRDGWSDKCTVEAAGQAESEDGLGFGSVVS